MAGYYLEFSGKVGYFTCRARHYLGLLRRHKIWVKVTHNFRGQRGGKTPASADLMRRSRAAQKCGSWVNL
jgi:hypothetical protein